MKSITSLITAFLESKRGRRNFKQLAQFLAALLLLVVLYSIVFHLLMEREGQEHTWLTGFYWTLTVMSTLGFGDITFHTDLGRAFSMVVLVTGMVTFLVLLPFTFIEFFYAPWVEAQAKARVPRELPSEIAGHIILTEYDVVTAALIRKLERHGYPYVLLVPEIDQALRLIDEGVRVVVGDLDRPESFERMRLSEAALMAATGTDVQNTNATFTVRELTQTVPVITTASDEAAEDILKLAGSSYVFRLAELMGQSLARRTTGGDAVTHVIGQFDDLLIAEATAAGTPLVGKSLAEVRLRDMAGVTVIGVWERGGFIVAGPETPITEKTVLVMAGSEEQLARYDELFCIYHVAEAPVLIIGGGRVGRATGRALAQRNMDFRIIERRPERVRWFPEQAVIGNAGELEVLEKAGIQQAPAVIITTHDDDSNIYLTIFCRKLRPDAQLISRASLDRNVGTLHRAGADFVMSYASMGANIIFNYLKRSDILGVTEGLNILKVKVPASLKGKSLLEANLRRRTGCHVIAIRSRGELNINPDPSLPFGDDDEIVLIGDADAEAKFFELFGGH